MTMRWVAILVCVFLARLEAQDAQSESWLNFRGHLGQGRAASDKPVPLSWDPNGTNIKWKTDLKGAGWSSPVILGDQIWMTAARSDSLSNPDADDRLQGPSPIERTAVNNLSLRAILR